MKLIADNSLSGGNPTIPVRWCLETSDVEKLKEAGAKDIHVLLAVAYENGREDRQFVPLEQTLTYLTFRWPGKHRVFARLFWPREHDVSLAGLRKLFLKKETKNEYDINVLGFEKTQVRTDFCNFSLILSKQLEGVAGADFDVVVPAEYFAKKPPAWLRWWANLWCEYPPVDECHFRRRCILAFTIQPPLILLWLVARTPVGLLYVVWLLLWGLRGIRLSPLFHPFDSKLSDIYKKGLCCTPYTHDCSVFRHDSEHNRKSFLWLLLHPFTILAGWGCLEALSRLFKMSYLMLLATAARWVWRVVVFLIHSATILEAVLIAAGVFAVYYVFGRFFLPAMLRYLKKNKPAREERKQQREQALERERQAWKEQLEQQRKQTLEALYNEMQCSTIPWVASINALPPKRRTLYLRFCDLKARVCRPFAG